MSAKLRQPRSRHLLAPALAALLLAGSPLAASANADHAGHGTMHAPAAGALAEGVVKKLDKAAGRVTIAHGPLPNGMPAMTMPFAVKDASWFGQLREGQKIRFSLEDVKGVLTVQHFEAVK
ncbi:MAG: copper-binding protein [Rhodocyclales bacterium]|nr:copper-binding protein [Rhodocyclales bacterium]